MSLVAVFGAGISGLATGIALRRAGVEDFVIYEEQPDVGGTWFRNTYPGLHCDIPSHLYCYTFEPNPDWSMVYAGQTEIRDYLRACATKYELLDRIRFSTRVETARFDERDRSWTLELADGSTCGHRLLVAATGGLTAPFIPKLAGLDSFSGPMWHSGAWRHDVALDGRRVAVIGSAASAVQVVPHVAGVAEELFVFSRTPNWVLPRGNRLYSEAEKRAFRNPANWHRLRRSLYRTALIQYRAFRRHPRGTDAVREAAMANLRSAVTDPAMIDALTPTYPPGCKRILWSDDYFPALAQEHVHLVPRGVAALSPDGVTDADGAHWPVDVIIFCTGYRLGARVDGRAAVDVVGPGGVTLRSALAARPEAYRGVAIPGFPNYFTICGINGVVSYAALFMSAELQAAYVARWARRFAAGELMSVEARAEATRRYNDDIQAELRNMSWAGDCPNFYRGPDGRVVSFHPGTVGRMRRELAGDHDDDFILARPSPAGQSSASPGPGDVQA